MQINQEEIIMEVLLCLKDVTTYAKSRNQIWHHGNMMEEYSTFFHSWSGSELYDHTKYEKKGIDIYGEKEIQMDMLREPPCVRSSASVTSVYNVQDRNIQESNKKEVSLNDNSWKVQLDPTQGEILCMSCVSDRYWV